MTALLHPEARLITADTGAVLAGASLRTKVDAAAEAFARHPSGVVFLLIQADVDAVVRYLGAVTAGTPALLLDPGLPVATLHAFIGRFRPVCVVGVSGRDAPPESYQVIEHAELGTVWRGTGSPPVAPHPALGLLLTTSGSTGNPKLVRLATTAVQANAESIALALGIDGDAVAPTSLPLHYTFGLSVLHSHVVRGASIVLGDGTFAQRSFWSAVSQHRVTSIAAVPYQYEILHRLGFDPAAYPSLRALTQAGGRLRPRLVHQFHDRMRGVGGALYVMYGQTEATARMSVLPPDRLEDKLGSVGLPVPGGEFAVRTADGRLTAARGTTGEVVYRGPNVMMGYAEAAEDLARGDDLAGVLDTGDLGYLDDDGYLFLVGRTKRIAKIFGIRVNLDDVERMLTDHGPIAATAADDGILVFVERADDELCGKIRAELAAGLGVHSSGVRVRHLGCLPLLPTGKVDYAALAEAE